MDQEVMQATVLKNRRSTNIKEWLDVFKKLKGLVTEAILLYLPIIVTSLIYILDIFSKVNLEYLEITADTFSTPLIIVLFFIIPWVFRSGVYASDPKNSIKEVLKDMIPSALALLFLGFCIYKGYINYSIESGLTRTDYYNIFGLVSIASLVDFVLGLHANIQSYTINKKGEGKDYIEDHDTDEEAQDQDSENGDLNVIDINKAHR